MVGLGGPLYFVREERSGAMTSDALKELSLGLACSGLIQGSGGTRRTYSTCLCGRFARVVRHWRRTQSSFGYVFGVSG